MKLIDKAALVAEIERRIKERDLQMNGGCWISSTYMYEDFLDFLNTLEVRDVDLDREIDKCLKQYHMLAVGEKDFTDIAKYFFELGLKAQRGE